MSKPYYTLVLFFNDVPAWESVFGDSDRSNVEYELEDYIQRGVKRHNIKIIKTKDWEMETIEAAIAKLNGE